MLILLISPLLSYPASADEQLSKVLEDVRKRYADLPGIVVTYKREILTKSAVMLGETIETDQAFGRFYFSPPHFLRVEQESPKKEMMTTDGNTLWWYIPHKRKAYRYPSHELGKELRLLSDIFQGLRAVEENFQVMLKGLNNKREYGLELTPGRPWQEIHHINISVAQGDNTIRVVEIYNYLGGMTRFTLGDLSVKEKFEQGFFGFVAPKGVQVIEGG